MRAGYSPKTAGQIGHDLLKKVEIGDLISKLQEKRGERTEITADRVLNEFAKIAFADLGDYMTWGPDGVTLKHKEELTDAQISVVAEATETVTEFGRNLKLKLHDKIGALNALGKHLGMFKDKLELSGSVNFNPLTSATHDELDDIIRAGEKRKGS